MGFSQRFDGIAPAAARPGAGLPSNGTFMARFSSLMGVRPLYALNA